MQITGEYKCVQDALHKITCRIRDNLSANGVVAEAKLKSNWKVNKEPVKGKPFFARGKSAYPSGRFQRRVFFTSFVFYWFPNSFIAFNSSKLIR